MGPKAPAVVREEKEDVFQAVLLADNFESSIFGPVWANLRYPNKNAFGEDAEENGGEEDFGEDVEGSKGKEKNGNQGPEEHHIDYKLAQECLIPLGNRKLLDYSLEALTVSGVQEIFIYCSSGVKGGNAIKDHIKKSRWSSLNVKINVISAEDCQSLGDALRDLDAKGMIRNDFILMGSGVITNTALKPLLDEHRKIMKTDKGAVMTLVHRNVPEGHRSRSCREKQAIVIDSSTNKVIAYSHKVQDIGLKIPLESMKHEVEVILDSVDTGIAVCSASVLPLFTDNFDFTSIPDFIKNILINEEVMGNTIYLNRFKTGYAARILDFDSFMGISLDVLQRWSYPLVPDMPFGSNPGDRVHQMGLNFVYKVSNVKTARDACIGPAVVLGSDTVIGCGATLKSSSVGRKCTIGQHAIVSNSQIGDNVSIDDECSLEMSIVLDGSQIKKGQKVPPRSLVVGNQIIEIQNPDEDSDEEFEDDEDHRYVESSDDEGHQEKDFKRFCGEVLESLHRGFTDNVDLDNLFVEIQGSRTANFMYFEDATIAVIKGIIGLAPKLHTDFTSLPVVAQWNKTRDVVTKYLELLKRFVKNEAGQQNLLKSIEEYANDNAFFRPMVMQVLRVYYDEDILAEDEILKWHKKESLYEAGGEIRKSIQKFIDWLETASEEESDEDSDD